jgi:hypothetical protein
MSHAYVYAILVDGIVRYVGKGSGRRLRTHEKIVRGILRRRASGEFAPAPSNFYERLISAYQDGSEILPLILVDGLTHPEAFRLEIVARDLYPQTQLWNAGKCWDNPDYRERQKARWLDPELRERHRRRVRDAMTAEHRSEISRRMKIAWSSRGKIAIAHERRWAAAFPYTAAGRLLLEIQNRPGMSFTDMFKGFPKLHPRKSLKKLRDRGLVIKADGKHGGYFAVHRHQTEGNDSGNNLSPGIG